MGKINEQNPDDILENIAEFAGIRQGSSDLDYSECFHKDSNSTGIHGENDEPAEIGAECGANWAEIRELIAICEDLPAGVREELIARGDSATDAAERDARERVDGCADSLSE